MSSDQLYLFDCLHTTREQSANLIFEIDLKNHLCELNLAKLQMFDRTFSLDSLCLHSGVNSGPGSCYNTDIDLFFGLFIKQFFTVEDECLNFNSSTVSDLSELRYSINTVLNSIFYLAKKKRLHQNDESILNTIQRISNRLLNYDDDVLFRNTCNSQSKQSTANYNLFHLHLDLRWKLLKHISLDIDEALQFEKILLTILNDLICLSIRKYDKFQDNKSERNQQYSSFSCRCVQEFWTFVVLLLERWHSQLEKTFWQILKNAIIELKVENDRAKSSIYLLVYDLSQLDCSKIGLSCPNEGFSSLIEVSLKNVCSSTELSESDIILCIKCLNEMLYLCKKSTNYIEPYSILWNFFCQKLDSQFTLYNLKNTEIIVTKSLKAFISRIISISESQNLDQNNSLDYFLTAFRSFLFHNPQMWSKFRGRLFTKFSAHKLKSLNDAGFYHVAAVFISISIVTEFNEVCMQLLTILEQLEDQRKQSLAFIHIVQTVLVIAVQKRISIEKYVNPLIKMVNGIAATKKNLHLMTAFIEGLQIIFEKDDNFLSDAYLLFDEWFNSYVNSKFNDLDLSLAINLVLQVIDKIKIAAENKAKWIERLDQYVVRHIKVLASSKNINNHGFGKLMASYVTIQTDSVKINSIILFFVSSSIHESIVSEFLGKLLSQTPLSFQILRNQTVLIQAWVRLCLTMDPEFADERERERESLVKVIETFPIIYNVIKFRDLSLSVDPVKKIIELIEQKASQEVNKDSTKLKDWCVIFFGDIDKWITDFLNNEGVPKNIILRIFTVTADLFKKCSELLYYKNEKDCLLNRILNTLFFNNRIRRPTPPFILNAIEKTFHVFLGALAKMNYESDFCIESHIRNLIIKYLPHYVDGFSPFIRLLDDDFDERLGVFVFRIICDHFICCKNRVPNENAREALFLFNTIIDIVKYRQNKLELFIDTVLSAVFEHVIFANEFTPTISTALRLIEQVCFLETKASIKSMIVRHIVSSSNKHLAFNANLLFKFLNRVNTMNRSILELALPEIEQKVADVEKMRGLFYDRTLRYLCKNNVSNI